MTIETLSVAGVRCIGSLHIEAFGVVTGFVGRNGQGKTSLLTSIAGVLSGRLEKEAVRQGAEYAHVAARCGNVMREVVVSKGGVSLKENGRGVSAAAFFLSGNCIAFYPEDLLMLSLEPSRRRRYLDMLIARMEEGYIELLGDYARALKQRNALLKAGIGGTTLDIFTEEVAALMARIHTRRCEKLAQMAPLVEAAYRELSGEAAGVEMAIAGMTDEHREGGVCREELLRRREQDMRLRETTFGAHRVDMAVTLGGVSAKQISRGELRTLTLACIVAEKRLFRQVRGEEAVVLLDDVFSELDRGRQERLAAAFGGGQVVVTTTKQEHMEVFPGAKCYTVAEGGIV